MSEVKGKLYFTITGMNYRYDSDFLGEVGGSMKSNNAFVEYEEDYQTSCPDKMEKDLFLMIETEGQCLKMTSASEVYENALVN